MRGKHAIFFAISDDLHSVLRDLESDFQIQYVLMGSFENREVAKYDSFGEIEHLGFTDYGDWAGLDHRYMIISRGAPVMVREVSQRKGGVRFLIDPLLNPNSLELTTKGIFTKKPHVIIAGRIAIVSGDQFANSVYRSLSSKIRKAFRKIGVSYVGPKAEEKLRDGWRLVQIESSPREYDLVLPPQERE